MMTLLVLPTRHTIQDQSTNGFYFDIGVPFFNTYTLGWLPAPTPPSCRGRYGPPLKSVCLQNATRSAWKAVAISLSDKRRQV